MSLAAWLIFLWSCMVACGEECPPGVLVMYRMVLKTEWSEEAFPKQYPEWRPPAQWSVVVGRSHNASGTLWRLGNTASDSLKLFVETGKADLLLREGTQQKRGILSEFYAPPVTQGVGSTEAIFFADSLHSKVSIISRITPSPDWFVGVDSFDLCLANKWLDSISLNLEPTDGGTDNGYTFTSPKWATDPRSEISLIRSRSPDHPASSFFYPKLERLPRIAFVRFLKMKEFCLTKQIDRDESKEENLVSDNEPVKRHNGESSPINELEEYDNSLKQETKKQKIKKSIMYGSEIRAFRSKSEATMKSKGKKHHYRKKNKACRVSDWSEWGNCNNHCGFGEQLRKRKIIHYASKSGRPCPPLEEIKRCRSMEACVNQTTGFFRWQ